MAPAQPPNLQEFEHHWQDEADAAFLYRVLASLEGDPKRRDVYMRLAEVEDRHVGIWSELLARSGRPAVAHRPSARARLLAFLGRRFGPGFLLPLLLAEEGREVKGYLALHRETPRGEVGGPEALVLARESAEHASTLAAMSGRNARAVAPGGIRADSCATSSTDSTTA